MNREHIYDELSRLTALADGWRRAAEIPAIERDLMLSRLRELYGSLVFETAAAYAEPGFAAAAAAEEDETNEIIDIVLDDVFEEPTEQPAEESEFRDDSAAP
ncbi:MAG: hypothetical protein K2J33_03875, partial [Alistipes sp.]|nr:hypothetical protein [Alistipes sp.]